MHSVILVIHVIIAVMLVGVILMQRSEGGALGGLGGSSVNSLMSGRSVGNLLTRVTAILAVCFMVTSLALAILAKSESTKASQSFLDKAAQTNAEKAKPAEKTTPAEPAKPALPSVPVSSK